MTCRKSQQRQQRAGSLAITRENPSLPSGRGGVWAGAAGNSLPLRRVRQLIPFYRGPVAQPPSATVCPHRLTVRPTGRGKEPALPTEWVNMGRSTGRASVVGCRRCFRNAFYDDAFSWNTTD